VCTYNSKRENKIQTYEFKVIQNSSDKKDQQKAFRGYNTWIFYHSITSSLSAKMHILKQPEHKPKKLKVHKFSKLIKEYDFGLMNGTSR